MAAGRLSNMEAEKVGGGLNLLEKCPIKRVKQLLHGFIDQFCGLVAVNYGDYDQYFTLKEWWEVKDRCLKVFERATRSSSQKGDDIAHEFLSELSVDFRQAFGECLESRHGDIRQKLLNDVCTINKSHLTDFDWQLKLIMGSDKMSDMRQPLACVQLCVEEDGEPRQVALEMNKEELSTFIAALENANKAISQLIT